jgi:outer membrane lipoprotein-sorting protein
MFRSTKGKILGFVVLIAQLIAAPVGRSQENSGRELLAGYIEMVTSIQTIYCEYSVVSKRTGTKTGVVFARTGDKWHYSYSSNRDNVGDGRKVVCSDGEHVYNYSLKGSGMSPVQISDYTRPIVTAPDQFLGLRLSNLDRTIQDIFDATEGNWNLSSRFDRSWLNAESVSSHVVSDTVFNVAVYIDPLQEFLPLEIEITPPDGHKHAGTWQMHYTIQEVLTVQDEFFDRPRLFPRVATLEQDYVGKKTLELNVSKVRINADLDDGLFRPIIPGGTTVADVPSDGRSTLGVKGDDAAVDARIRELTEEAKTNVGRGVKVAAAFCSFTAVAVVVFLTYRYRSRLTSGGT